MKLSTILTSLLAIPTALAAVVYYDTVYDQADEALTSVACSNGDNGLITKYHWTDLGDVPNFPNVGAAFAVEGWNSKNCGTCWQLTFNGTSINVAAIDHAGAGTFNIALSAMNKLTNNQAEFLGRVNAQAQQVPATACGFKA